MLCKISEDVAVCEVCVFDTETYNLFTHHDMCLGTNLFLSVNYRAKLDLNSTEKWSLNFG